MRIKLKILSFSTLLCVAISSASAEDALTGQEIAFDRTKGNCLACHAIPGEPSAKSAGDIGPPLIGMKSRYTDRAKLRAQIWDATVINPKSGMPPFGRNKILTEAEVDKVTDYVYGL